MSLSVLWFVCPAVAKIPAAAGHLPSEGPASPTSIPWVSPSTEPTKVPEPLFNYFTSTRHQTDFNLSMHILEVDPSSDRVAVRPVSSHDTLFGYEYLSVMNEKWEALASINGGFSHPDGLLGGLYASEGRLYTPGTGKFPVLFLKNGQAMIKDARSEIWIEDLEGKSRALDHFYFNQYPKGDGLYVFTPDYGSTNRIESSHLNAVFSQGEIRGLLSQNSSYEIPQDGFLISAVGKAARDRLKASIKPGMKVGIEYDIIAGEDKINDFTWAYECGSWILKDGEVVAPKTDTWVGTLTIRTPRTAVGIKADGTLVFVVADGRQKGLSDGLTGEELGQELLELGILNAVFLDGGASSEMIVDNKIVNSPSAGRERMLSSAFVFIKK